MTYSKKFRRNGYEFIVTVEFKEKPPVRKAEPFGHRGWVRAVGKNKQASYTFIDLTKFTQRAMTEYADHLADLIRQDEKEPINQELKSLGYEPDNV